MKREASTSAGALHVTVDEGATAVAPLLVALERAGLTPASVNVSRPSLDDVFLALTGRTLRDSDPIAA